MTMMFATFDDIILSQGSIKENHMRSDPSTLKLSKGSSGHTYDNISCTSSASTSSRDSRGSQRSMLSRSNYSYSCEDAISTGKAAEGPEIHEVKVVFVKYPDECCPKFCTQKCFFCIDAFDRTVIGRVWGSFRFAMFRLVENSYFETFIILMILLSSLALVRLSFCGSLNMFEIKVILVNRVCVLQGFSLSQVHNNIVVLTQGQLS